MRKMQAIGLMSGTSLDGIDAALIETDGISVTSRNVNLGHCYSAEFAKELKKLTLTGQNDPEVEKKLTELHAECVLELLKQNNLDANQIDLIGFHGQTIAHDPANRITRQIGDGKLLSKLTGIKVVYDFRIDDVLAGGQGAPLVPIYHQALCHNLPKPIAILNIGGVANVTWIGEHNQLLAFDTGTGNALINDWLLSKAGLTMDEGGKIAAKGTADMAIVESVLNDPYFQKTPPKSLDRNHFAYALKAVEGLSLEDGAATLSLITAKSIAKALDFMPQKPLSWLVCGGGAHNNFLMDSLNSMLGEVRPISSIDANGDMLEAEAFGFLAARSYLGLPISFPTTTGVSKPMTGGKVVDHHKI